MTTEIKSDPLLPDNWPSAWPENTCSGLLKAQPEDFRVYEIPLVEPEGEGEHIWLHIVKRGANTAWIAGNIARLAQVKDMDVGYAGLKDRHAVTSQWFSIYLPERAMPEGGIDFSLLNNDECQVVQVTRHVRKLRRGDLQGNRFEICIRHIEGDRAALESNLSSIQQFGFPNYFGKQRFGHDGGNLTQGLAMLKREIRVRNRNKKSLYLSAVRSWLFNRVLAARVTKGQWHSLLEGDLADEKGLPTGPLWGRGRSALSGQALALETEELSDSAEILDALEHAGLSQERRSLVVMPTDMSWQWLESEPDVLNVCFTLEPGAYATGLLSEVLSLREPERLDIMPEQADKESGE
ncbi:MAG: tRNA pseudouridine(13) synthase TruD [Oceanobacter sp.]